jgi:hypothetical protein
MELRRVTTLVPRAHMVRGQMAMETVLSTLFVVLQIVHRTLVLPLEKPMQQLTRSVLHVVTKHGLQLLETANQTPTAEDKSMATVVTRLSPMWNRVMSHTVTLLQELAGHVTEEATPLTMRPTVPLALLSWGAQPPRVLLPMIHGPHALACTQNTPSEVLVLLIRAQ